MLPPSKHGRAVVAVPPLDGFQVLAFTSPVGVDCFRQLLREGRDARALCGMTVAAVGEKRRHRCARRHRGRCGARDIRRRRWGMRCVLPARLCAGQHSAGGRTRGFARAGAGANGGRRLVRRTVCLRNGAARGRAVDPHAYDWVTFTSASGAEGFARMCARAEFQAFHEVSALCIDSRRRKGHARSACASAWRGRRPLKV